MAEHADTLLPALERRAAELKKQVDMLYGIEKLVKSQNWHFFNDLVAYVSGNIIRKGKAARDTLASDRCFQQLNGIEEINTAISNLINNKDKTLSDYNDVLKQMNDLAKRKSA